MGSGASHDDCMIDGLVRKRAERAGEMLRIQGTSPLVVVRRADFGAGRGGDRSELAA
jgi:hypothetical protein